MLRNSTTSSLRLNFAKKLMFKRQYTKLKFYNKVTIYVNLRER